VSDTSSRQPPSDSAIIEKVGLDITNYSAWSDLDALSTKTEFDGLDVMIESLEFDEKSGEFHVDVVLNVGLHFGGKADDGFSTGDAFPGCLTGWVLENGELDITNITVDTSSFHE